MATNIKIGKKLGLICCDNFTSSFELWEEILKKKYSIKYFKDILLATEDIYLLHFDKGAERRYKVDRLGSFWGGIISNNKLYGNNECGKYLMQIRNNLLIL